MVNDTKGRLLDVAQELAQTRGFNAFSFKDVAAGVGISTASVHHHFPTKADLGRELVERYHARFAEKLTDIDSNTRTERRKLVMFTDLFRQTLIQGNRVCLCGMLATEYVTLPSAMQKEVRLFYDETEHWLDGVLRAGRSAGELVFEGSPAEVGKMFLATLEGAMITARAFDDEKRLARSGRLLVASLDAKKS